MSEHARVALSEPPLVPPSPRRLEIITDLLRLAADPHSTAAAWEGVKGSGTALPIRPHEPHCALASRTASGRSCTCWLRSLDELHRCLRTMRAVQRPLWYAVYERYVAATRKPTLVTVKAGRPQLGQNQQALSLVNRADLSKRGDGQTRLLVETWRPALKPERIQQGVVWLADAFQGPLQLPLDLYHAA